MTNNKMTTNNIVQVQATIKGIRPLLFHKFGPDALPLEKQEKTGVAGNNPQEWRKSIMVTKEGQLFLEPTYIFSTIKGGAKFVPKGRGSIQTSVVATLLVMDNKILLDRWFPGYPCDKEIDINTVPVPDSDPDLPVYLDIRGVTNPSTRGRNVRYRIACSPGWSCSFTIQFDKTICSRAEMESALINAGKLVGVGNGRSIGMGRFSVENFVEI